MVDKKALECTVLLKCCHNIALSENISSHCQQGILVCLLLVLSRGGTLHDNESLLINLCSTCLNTSGSIVCSIVLPHFISKGAGLSFYSSPLDLSKFFLV